MFKRLLLPSLLMLALIGAASTAFAQDKPAKTIDPAAYDHPVRLACIGDSITMGAGLKAPKTENYVMQLTAMLGPKWEVRNFGVSGTTLLNVSNRPYIERKEYKTSHDFNPDVIVIMLGTNDTKPMNWDASKDRFIADYKALIDSYAKLPGHPRIWICKPVPAYPGFGGINDKTLTEEVNPKIEQVAKETGVGLLDLHAALSDRKDLFPDTVHPNLEGARLIAEAVFKALTGKPAPAPAAKEPTPEVKELTPAAATK